MRLIPVALAILTLSAFSSRANAQNEYARTVGDTLKYVERTNVDVRVETPQGPIDVGVVVAADMELTFSHPDTLRAWYVNLGVSSRSPLGNANPNTAPVVQKPFTLLFKSDGSVIRLSTPDVPDELRTIADVRRQFDDFFLLLPPDDLVPGYSWEYNVSRADSSAREGRNAFTKRGMLTVIGDTTVAGISGLKIVGDLQSTLFASSRDANTGAQVVNEIEGVEHNVFVFSPDLGVLLSRDWRADLGGTSEFQGGPMPILMQQDITYDATLRLEP